ncbi:hypothetical protein GCM10022419_036070 [Nonomuraea rosea]|uniref:Uncharacterized protein n=1 Tax=Nonomuraea rosea TaxID=638574 RepID=A0ABP6WMP5_9ACTN
MTRTKTWIRREGPRPPADPGSWRSPATIIAVAALAVGLLSAYLAWDSARSSRLAAEAGQRESGRRSLLEVSAVSAYLTDGLAGERIPLGEPGAAPRKESGLRGPLIDLTLRNRGSGEGLIDSVTVRVRRSELLTGCYAAGGIERVSAYYDVPIDTRARTPFTASKEVRFSVPAGEHDRFTLTLGPAKDLDAAGTWYGVVDVILHHEDGQDIEVGPIAVVDAGSDPYFYPKGSTWSYERSADPACMRLNARAIAEVAALDGVVMSKEFATLHSVLRHFH